jgi:hypothetical protein
MLPKKFKLSSSNRLGGTHGRELLVEMMAEPQPADVTLFLRRMQNRDWEALDKLIDLVYPQLHRIAEAFLRNEGRERMRQPTALVNKAYLRLVAQRDQDRQNRAHYFVVAARMMRRYRLNRPALVSRRNGRRGVAPGRCPINSIAPSIVRPPRKRSSTTCAGLSGASSSNRRTDAHCSAVMSEFL